jgi:hypothetical protein
MSPAQRIAIEHPCRFAFETAHPRFAHRLPGASLVLTINSGYE